MDLRERLAEATKEAMRARDTQRLSTLRLVSAAIKDREIALRSEVGSDAVLGESELYALLGKMLRQRQDSARAFEEAGRLELAERELAEMGYIQEFMPRQLGEAEVEAAIDSAIAATGATGLRDMGAVMAALRARHAGEIDFAAAGPRVKARLMG